jgi:hypothetical protein
VLGHRQELDVGEAVLVEIGGQLVGQLPIGQRPVAVLRHALPRAEMTFVDGERLVQRIALLSRRDPLRVVPLVLRLEHHAGGAGRHLGGEGERIHLQPELAVGVDDLVLVPLAGSHPRQEDLPQTRDAEAAHGIEPPVPRVEVADHPHAAGVGRPHDERGPGRALVLADMGAEVAPHLLVPAFADQVEVEVPERRPEPVGVFDREGGAVGIPDFELVAVAGEVRDGTVQPDGEHAGRMLAVHPGALPVREDDGHGLGVGPVAPHDRSVTVGMGAEQVVRVAVLAGDELLELDFQRVDGG